MVTRRLAWLLPVFVGLFFAADAAAQDVSATVDRTTIRVDETVNLSITGGTGGRRVGSPEGDDFVVVSHSTFSEMQIINGQRSHSTTTTLVLRPVREGNLTIGRIPVETASGVRHTDPISITVTAADAAPQQQAPTVAPVDPVRPTRRTEPGGVREGPATLQPPPEPLAETLFAPPVPRVPRGEPFIMATTTDATPVVGQQVIVDYVLFTPASAFGVEGIELTEPEFAGLWFMDVTEMRSAGFRGRLGTRRVGAELYEAQVLRSYALFPLESGELVVPPIELEMAFRGFARRSGRRVVRSTPLLLEARDPPVLDQPPEFAPGNVGVFRLSVDTDHDIVRVGDTVHVSVSVFGAGLLSRLRLPEFPDLDGARVFPPDDEENGQTGSDLWMRGSAVRRVALVPSREGTLIVPPMPFAYYDPWAEAYVRLETEPVTIQVSGVNPSAPVVEEDPAEPVADDWLEALPEYRSTEGGRGRGTWFRGPAYAALVATPPLAFGLVLLLGGVRRRREETFEDRKKDTAAKRAEQALAAADAATIAKALRAYVADISGSPAGGLTLAALKTRAASVSTAAAANALAEVVRQAEEARYGGGVDEAALRDAATAAVREMEEGR